MSNKPRKRSAVALAFGTTIALGAGLAGAAAPGTAKGPSTTTDPYVIPIDATKVQIMSLLTIDDPNPGAGYVVAGLPDGLGAFPNGAGGVTLISNHELQGAGSVRGHGFNGAFFSRHTIDPTTLAVSGSADLLATPGSVDWSGVTARAWARFCSGDLSGPNQLFNAVSGKGYNGRLFFAGEETAGGLAVAADPVAGDAKVLTDLGQMAWENIVLADTATSDVTLAMANNDTTGQANYFYVGTKNSSGVTKYDKAGLTGGSKFGIVVGGALTDAAFRTAFGKNNPQAWTPTTAIVATTAGPIQTELAGKSAIQMDRTEDGAWDPSNPNDYYFVTTGNSQSAAQLAKGGKGGLWKMSFTDRTNPALGGTLTLLLDGTEGAGPNTAMYMPDNLTIDAAGHIVIQEDPGNTPYVARIWAYDIATKQLAPIATFDNRFVSGDPGFLTADEESSGIIPAPAAFGANTFLFDAQVHTGAGLSAASAQVERGQYLEMTIDFAQLFPTVTPEVPEAPLSVLLPLSALGIGAGAFAFMRRRRNTMA